MLGVAISVGASQVLAHKSGDVGPLLDMPLGSITVVTTAASAHGIAVIHTVTDEVIYAPPIEKDKATQSR
jgi:hypothetical protein